MQTTPRTWPENTEPTDLQLAAWLGACTLTERIDFVRHAKAAQRASFACFIGNHDGLERELRLTTSYAMRYKSAWVSARDRARATRLVLLAALDSEA